jgi:hypothetical protein
MEYGARVVGRANIRPEDRVVLHDVSLAGANFSGRKLVQISVAGSTLTACRFDKIRAEHASLGGGRQMSRFVDCTFDGSRLTLGAGGFARFERCSFRDVDLRHWFCFAVELVDCTFTGRLRKAIFNGTVPAQQRAMAGRASNEFQGNDFSGLELIGVTFRTGIDLTLQRLPSGQAYLYVADAAASVQRARAAVVRWDDLDLRQEALGFIGILDNEVSGGQRQLLLRKDDYRLSRNGIDALFELLAGEGPRPQHSPADPG